MPLYEYKCLRCGRDEVKFVSILARDSQKCSICKDALERRISAPRIGHFKPRLFENFGPENVWIPSKNALREECNKRGMDSDELH